MNRSQIENETLFCSKYDELDELVNSFEPYNLTKISAIIRHLIIDGSPLMDQINRTYKLSITFPVKKTNTPEIEQVKRDKLLSKVVLIVEEKRITVKDVIKFEANVKGGVHSREAHLDKEEEKKMDFLARSFQIGGYRPTQRIMKSVGRIVLTGLKELRTKCE